MRIKEKSILNTPLNQLKSTSLTINRDIYNAIYSNPFIRDLPDIAANYGLYSTFVVGQEDIYFVYGFHKELIHYGKFIEVRGNLYAEQKLEQHGYINNTNNMPILNRDWNAFKIDKQISQLDQLVWNMVSLELLYQRFRLYKLRMPEFIYWTSNEMAELRNYISVVDNIQIKENAAKESFRQREKVHLQKLAVWEWPIQPGAEKPGYLAFVYLSGCCPKTTDLKKSEKVYNDPKCWKKSFLSKNSDLCILTLEEKAANYVIAGLERMGFLYRDIPYDKNISRNFENERAMINKVLYPGNSDKAESRKFKEFAIHKYSAGAADYLLDQYTESLFTKEEVEYGNLLYSALVDERIGKGELNPEVAAYLFFVPSSAMDDFKAYSKKMHIKYGYPQASWLKTHYMQGVYLITELSNMGIVNDCLQAFQTVELGNHLVSLKHDSPSELRTRHKNGISMYTFSDPWHYERGAITGDMIQMGEDGIVTSKTQKLPLKALSGVPTCHPKSDLIKAGFLVNNDYEIN